MEPNGNEAHNDINRNEVIQNEADGNINVNERNEGERILAEEPREEKLDEKQKNKKSKKKTKPKGISHPKIIKNYVPQEYIDLLYDTPVKFFEIINTIVEKLQKDNCIMDFCETSLITHYLFLLEKNYKKENEKEINETYEQNFELFFNKMKPLFSIKSRTEENFVFTFSKIKNKHFFLTTTIRLICLNIINEELLLCTNIKGESLIDNLVGEIKSHYSSIVKNKELYNDYKELFDKINEYFPRLYVDNIKGESKIEIEKIRNEIKFDKEIITKNNINNVVQEIKTIFTNSPVLIDSLVYMDKIKYNLVSFIIDKNDFDNGLELLKSFDNDIKDENIKLNHSSFLYENLLFFLNKTKNFDEKSEKYLLFLIDLAQKYKGNKKSENLYKDTNTLQNVFHLLFGNLYLSFDAVRKYYNILCDKLLENNDKIITNFLSTQDRKSFYPFLSFLINQSFFSDKEKLPQIEEFFNIITQKVILPMKEKKPKKEIITTSQKEKKENDLSPYLILFVSQNFESQFQILFRFFMKNKLIKLFEKTNDEYLLTKLENESLSYNTFYFLFSYIRSLNHIWEDSMSFDVTIHFLLHGFSLCKDKEMKEIFYFYEEQVEKYKDLLDKAKPLLIEEQNLKSKANKNCIPG